MSMRDVPLVLIVAPIPIEVEAVRAAFGGVTQRLPLPGNRSVDLLRHMTEGGCVFDVAIAEGGVGNPNMAVSATLAVMNFDPDLIVVCGIAGGLKDVSIGDVVIATEVVYTVPGKSESHFRPRYPRAVAGSSIRSLCSRLARASKHRAEPVGRRVLHGVVATGEAVVAARDSVERQRIADFASDAIAVEMEAWGMANLCQSLDRLDWVVVRGISDLADEDKSRADHGQTDVAQRAAVVALELVSEWSASLGVASPPKKPMFAEPGGYVPTPSADLLVSAIGAHSVVVLTGASGSGKTTVSRAIMAAAHRGMETLSRAALVELSVLDSAETLAQRLAAQMTETVPGFEGSLRSRSVMRTAVEMIRTDRMHQLVIEPLQLLQIDEPTLIVVDGLDRVGLPGSNQQVGSDSVFTAIQDLAAAVAKSRSELRLVLTGRAIPDGLSGYEQVVMLPPTADALHSMVRWRSNSSTVADAVVGSGVRNWAEAVVLAEIAISGSGVTASSTALTSALPLLGIEVSDESSEWVLLSILASVTAAMEFPSSAALSAFRWLGYSESEFASARLKVASLVVDNGDSISLFHDSIAVEIAATVTAELLDRCKSAVTNAVAKAPGGTSVELTRVTHDLLVASLIEKGSPGDATLALRRSLMASPRENIERIDQWAQQISILPPSLERSATLAELQAERLVHAGHVDGYRKALELSVEFRASVENEFGRESRLWCLAQHLVALWTGQTGDVGAAVGLLDDVVDMFAVLGISECWDGLNAQAERAYWIGASGDYSSAIVQLAKLVERAGDLFMAGDSLSLDTRHNLAFFVGRGGDPGAARDQFKAIVADRVRWAGPRHPETLTGLHEIAFWTAEAGDAKAGLRAFESLLPVRIEVMGRNHDRTLRNRFHIARLKSIEDPRAGLLSALDVFKDAVHALGPDAPTTRDAERLVSVVAEGS